MQMLTRRSGCQPRSGSETTARVVRDRGLHNAGDVDSEQLKSIGNRFEQEALFSLKKTVGTNAGTGTLMPRDTDQDFPIPGVVDYAVTVLAEPGFNNAQQE
jgi:hypothetical protein